MSIGVNAPAELDLNSSVTLSASNAVWVGFSATGTLNISNGGVVNDADGAFGAVSGVAGTAAVSGSGSQWNNSNDMSVGLNGEGALTISGGGLVSDANGYIGANSGSVGTVMVSGSGSLFNASFLSVGENGQGTLAISGGGQVSFTFADIGARGASTGTVTVSGMGSELNGPAISAIYVGDQGSGTLSVTGGAVVNVSGVRIGLVPGSAGSVVVSGAGSRLNAQQALELGLSSELPGETQGTLLVENGGVVETASPTGGVILYGGNGGVSSVTVTGIGSLLRTPELDVGQEGGRAMLTVQSSGVISDIQGYVGLFGTAGTATVSGVGSTWENSGILSVGSNGGNGTLTITGGGLVTDAAGVIGNSVFGGTEFPGTGTVTVSGTGSVWGNGSTLDVGKYGAGNLAVQNGGLVSAGTLTSPGTITIDALGTVDAKGGTLQGTVINHGVLDPLGTITINGDYTQGVDGTLILDVAGTGAGDFGQLNVSGNATFGGTIQFDFIDGFAPSKGDAFDFINVGGNADFSGASIDFAGLLPGFNYADSFQNGQFILTALNDGVASSPTLTTGLRF